MRNTLIAAIICSVLFAACQSAESSTENISFDSSIVTHTNAGTQVSDPPVATEPVQINPQAIPAATTTPATTISTTPSQTISTPTANAGNSTTAAGMNPPHGQPGHRCDIAVGAPLNSAPAKTTTATNTAQPVVMNTTAVPVKTAPGMNPPHGQPGHRCDIAVGAPLNSAPPKVIAPTTITKTATDTKATEVTPAAINVDTSKKQ
ncbi:MAG: hypothetical protein ABI741_12300 [Ferruginibacter sp.]